MSIETLVLIDKRIDASEAEALRDRWDFGQELLAKRVGKQLPKGLLAEVVEATGKSRSELKYRMQFAEKYPTEPEVANALATFTSWFQVTQSFSKKKEPAQLDPGPKPEERKMKGKLNPRKRVVRKSQSIASASASARVPEKHAPFVERLAKALKGMTLSSDPTTEYVAACLALADLVASLQEEGK